MLEFLNVSELQWKCVQAVNIQIMSEDSNEYQTGFKGVWDTTNHTKQLLLL